MEIRTLKYFLAVAREGKITAAAESLHLTQPTLTRQIKDLEEELGCALFTRRSHRVELTADGMRLRKRAEEIVQLVERTAGEFTLPDEGLQGEIHIGGGETRAIRRLADVLKGLRDDYPLISFHLYSGNAEEVTERLDKGLLDFGLVIQPADISKYDFLDLPDRDVWGVVMRKDSPLAEKDAIERSDLEGLPLIFSRQARSSYRSGNEMEEWFGGSLDHLEVVTTFNLVYNAAIMVEAGLGYAVTIDGIADVSPSSPLCFRPLKPRLESGLSLIWKKYQVFSPAAQVFLDRLEEAT